MTRLFLAVLLAGFVGDVSLYAKPLSEKNVQKAQVVRPWQPTYSSEVTFSSKAQLKDMVDGNVMTESNLDALDKFHKLALKKLGGRADIKSIEYLDHADKFGADLVKVRYKDGWGFDVTLDPACLEVILTPFKTDQLNSAMKARIQKDIFNTMKSIGLTPRVNNQEVGGGHVHAGMLSTFGVDNIRLFRNQVVDFANHPEFGLGAMDYDPENARSFIRMKKSKRERLARWVKQVDSGHYSTVRRAATALVNDVFLENKPATAKNILPEKYWVLNFLRMGYMDTWDTLKPNDTWNDYIVYAAFDEVEAATRTLEFRGLRAPRNADELFKNVELIHARLKYLNEIDKNIPLHPKFLEGKAPTTREMAERFYNWIKATGLNPIEYVYLLPSNSKERADFKVWHQEYLKLAKRDGLGDGELIEAAPCLTPLQKIVAK